ncbi:MAG: DUF932 domain-containing protein, partial [Candidatus Aegiribacteria sp.]|nr:DUF932 domain-containing protein [Candidatus Aegiribacteria sp.]
MQGYTMEDFTRQLVEVERNKADYVVPTTKMEMQEDERLAFGGMRYDLNSWAHGQLASKLRIPKTYYDRIGEYPGLRTKNVNTLLEREEGKRMVRTVGNTARAVVSDRFKPIDNMLVANAFTSALEHSKESGGRNVDIQSGTVTEKRMYLQVTFPAMEAPVEVGDIVQYGFTLSNSEVGAGAIDIRHMVWRLKCKNGYVGSSL